MATVKDAEIRRLRDIVNELVRAVGIDHYDVPLDTQVHFDGEVLHVVRYARNGDGKHLLDQDGAAVRERASIRITASLEAIQNVAWVER